MSVHTTSPPTTAVGSLHPRGQQQRQKLPKGTNGHCFHTYYHLLKFSPSWYEYVTPVDWKLYVDIQTDFSLTMLGTVRVKLQGHLVLADQN